MLWQFCLQDDFCQQCRYQHGQPCSCRVWSHSMRSNCTCSGLNNDLKHVAVCCSQQGSGIDVQSWHNGIRSHSAMPPPLPMPCPACSNGVVASSSSVTQLAANFQMTALLADHPEMGMVVLKWIPWSREGGLEQVREGVSGWMGGWAGKGGQIHACRAVSCHLSTTCGSDMCGGCNVCGSTSTQGLFPR